jgi:hypothetical protein
MASNAIDKYSTIGPIALTAPRAYYTTEHFFVVSKTPATAQAFAEFVASRAVLLD